MHPNFNIFGFLCNNTSTIQYTVTPNSHLSTYFRLKFFFQFFLRYIPILISSIRTLSHVQHSKHSHNKHLTPLSHIFQVFSPRILFQFPRPFYFSSPHFSFSLVSAGISHCIVSLPFEFLDFYAGRFVRLHRNFSATPISTDPELRLPSTKMLPPSPLFPCLDFY